jgi:hypothetical protein
MAVGLLGALAVRAVMALKQGDLDEHASGSAVGPIGGKNPSGTP